MPVCACLYCGPIASPSGPRGLVYEPVSLVDLFPTVLQLAGIKPPAGIDGASLAACLSDPASPRPGPAVMTWGRGNHSVRTAQWRLTRYVDGAEDFGPDNTVRAVIGGNG